MSASLSTTVVNIPTYSWSVEVITHELGHNFGLPHTHSCTWPLDPNSPAVKEKIDDCGNLAGYTTEGTCTTTTTSGQGTIMSYCHLVSGRGINFNLGFGTKPGDKMRAEVAAASSLTGLVSPSVSNLLSCTAGSFTLTASGCQGPSGSVSYRWYSASTGGTLLHTGATYSTPTISTTTVYHVECTVSQGCTSARTAATVTIYSPSQALTPPTTQSVSFCANQSVTLFASGCQSGAQYKWYANSTATTALTTGQTYTTPVLSATTQYVAACESSGCLSSSRVTATATQTATVCTYCTVPNQDCTDGDQITRVRIQQNTTDLLNRTSTCATNGYELISTPVTNLTIGTAYSITVTNPGTYPEGLRVWIDYNKNGLFESTEVIQNVNSSTWTSNTASFTIPNTATTGNTRMRVKLAYESNVTDPCAGGGYGEAEDYIINIVSNCPQSMTLLSPADNITTGNVTKQASSANNGLITARNKIQNLNTRATYQAKSILLDTGFTAEQGTIFRAEIGGCN
jgi:hypothetical protein